MEVTGAKIKVFISYSHDSKEHARRVLRLSDRLRSDGIDSRIDQYEIAPREGWRRWMDRQITWADFVLMICTHSYHRRVRGDEDPDRGLGATYEGSLLLQSLYAAGMRNERTIPVLFEGAKTEDIPFPLQMYTRWRLWDQYEGLYRHLTGQPKIVARELGKLRSLPPRPSAGSVYCEADSKFQELPTETDLVPAPPTKRSPFLAINLGLLAIMILWLHIWTFRFTDVFIETLAGFTLFGLGAGFLTLVKPRSSLRAWLGQSITHSLLPNPWITLVILICLTAGAVFTLSHGTLVFHTFDEDGDGTLKIQRMGANDQPIGKPEIEYALQASEKRRFLLASGLGKDRMYQVRFAQLPPRSVRVRFLERTMLIAPDYFLRQPVLLLRPSSQLLFVAAGLAEKGRPLSLEIRRGQDLIGRLPQYTGRAILVGSDQIPTSDLARLRELWTRELAADGRDRLIQNLLPFKPLTDTLLNSGETLKVKLKTAAGNSYGLTLVDVNSNSQAFLQEAVIHVPRR